ncbi:MAG: alpha/beta fold hydrolase [Pseudomonadota bacterium]
MFFKKRRTKHSLANVILHGTVMSLWLLERFIKADIHISGDKNIPDNPILYVVNHFTRTETFLLPYIIKKTTDNIPNSLADSSFFKGKFGDYLKAVGAISSGEPDRNNIIIGDLITGRKNWVIFPEGAMIKTKEVIHKRNFMVNYPGRKGPIHTGAAYLAVLSELYKREIISANKKGDEKKVSDYLKRFSIETIDEISDKETTIIPTNLTYFPIRPGKNIIQTLASKFIKGIPERLEEELEIEGNLLFSDSDIHVTFGTQVNVRDFLDNYYFRKNNPFAPITVYLKKRRYGDDPAGFKLKSISRRLTDHFMDRVYSMATINMDHLFSHGLLSLDKKKTSDYLFKCKLFLACEKLKKEKRFNIHPYLNNLPIELLADEREKNYNNFKELAIKEEIIRKSNGTYFIDTRRLEIPHEFHKIRVESTIKVIINEAESVNGFYKTVKKEFRRSRKKVRSKIADLISKVDKEMFTEDYDRYYDKELSKLKEVGAPFYLNQGKSKTGILICHGYMAAPEEVRLLGNSLAESGYSVYGPRLKGHGTSPYNLADVTWKDWYDSFNRGYAILKNTCERVIIGGFSTGGTLALLAAANKEDKIAGLFTVNAPLQLKSIKTKLVGPICFWNELLEKFNIEEGRLEFVDNHAENPEINYSKNSIKGLRELNLLMEKTRESLGKVSAPALVIQEKNDPVVDPRSASIILDGIVSKEREFHTFEFNRHGILRRERCEEVFDKVKEFVEKVA